MMRKTMLEKLCIPKMERLSNLSSISHNQQYQYFSWAFLTRKASFSQQISWLIFRARSIVKDIPSKVFWNCNEHH